MPLFALLTRLSTNLPTAPFGGEQQVGPKAIAEIGDRVSAAIKQQVPEARWIASYAVLGPYDYLDIFEAPDAETAAKVAVLVHTYGHATTETWVLTPWERFREVLPS
ncbi:GYD domain-containing protein [Thermorudis peleae]|uniref:GYD domain-containing protein n=1 Tax=Thermorudis peleae TaxID=1382356 RepID=UPI00056E8ADC|nr:GYD domain-containing protein [Thermorudis peleae]MBX6754651.1 GYD domain-containing protein [Thermorudis peleae]